MDSRKQTPADRRGARTRRQPRDPAPGRAEPGWNPADDLYGDDAQPTDRDLGLHRGKFAKRPPVRRRHG